MEKEGQINKFICEICGGELITKNLDDGVTPMFIRNIPGDVDHLKKCNGSLVSEWYRVDQSLIHTHEWYAPGKAEIKKMPAQYRYHYEQGGLKLRLKLPEATNE